MADSQSSPVNPFIVVCLLVVAGAGGASMWEELFSSSSKVEQNNVVAAAPDAVLTEAVSSEAPAEPLSAADEEQLISPTPQDSQTENPALSVEAKPQPDTFPDAVKRAEQAASLEQSAQSKDDWQLVLNRWQQAIALMEAVPISSPNYGQVAAKLASYRQNQTYAQSQAAQPLPENTQTGRVVVGNDEDEDLASTDVPTPNSEANSDSAVEPSVNDVSSSEGDNATASSSSERQVYSAPIVRRSGGTPIIQVLFNDEYTVEMIVDTGASGTVITRRVAQSLGVQPTGQTNVSTASAQNVSFLLGEVDSIGVDGAALENVVVAIAGPELDIGLLGNDFFGQYDVTVRSDVVEFQER